MPDQINEITKMNYPAKVLGSIFGVIVGLAMVVGSLFLFYYNEGRADLSTVAKDAVEISAQQINSQAEGKFVAATGQVSATGQIGDNFFLKPGDWVVVERLAEMYAWTEDKSEHEDVDGDRTTTYSYAKAWTRVPEDSSRFHDTTGHVNPKMPFLSERYYADQSKLGAYDFDIKSVTLPNLNMVILTPQNVSLKDNAVLAGDGFIKIYADKNATGTENIGDIRVSYYALKTGTQLTLFGKASGNRLEPFFSKQGDKIFRCFEGGKDQGVAMMHSEYTFTTWAMRILGFMLLWFGLTLIFGPISAVLGFIPFLGQATGCLVALATFIVALALSAVLIFIFKIVHSVLFVLLIIAGLVYLVFLGFKKIKQKSIDQKK